MTRVINIYVFYCFTNAGDWNIARRSEIPKEWNVQLTQINISIVFASPWSIAIGAALGVGDTSLPRRPVWIGYV